MSTKRDKKRKQDNDSQTVKRQKTDTKDASKDTPQFLDPVNAFILQAGIEKVRMQIFENQLKKYGGSISKALNDNVTHIVVDDKMEVDRMFRLLKVDTPPTDVLIVKSQWLSLCFREKKLIDSSQHTLDVSEFTVTKSQTSSTSVSQTTSSKTPVSNATDRPPKVGMMFGHSCNIATKTAPEGDSDSDYCPSDGAGGTKGSDSDSDPESTTSSSITPSTSPAKTLPSGNWVCTQSSKVQVENQNKHITDKLEEMVHTYESTNDKWRAFGYQKAIQVLKKQPKPIATFEEAKALPGVGKRLAEKIWEIAESGELRKLNEFKQSEDLKVIEMFKDVWGAGALTARTWYQQGLRTLEDLKTKAHLTYQQKIGLKHYHDFLDRMPREEAGEIETVVRETAESLLEGVVAQACGSYRRGKATCGDVDILVTHPDGKSHRGLFSKLLAKLKEQGFLTDDLVTAEDNGNQRKYLGVCKLPGENRKYRRIDIIVVPYDEYACALVYFTGSAHFNRSLRHLAKKMGMSLSEHSLNTGVVRRGNEKIYEGTPVPTPTEESVLTTLGVPYRPPEERDH